LPLLREAPCRIPPPVGLTGQPAAIRVSHVHRARRSGLTAARRIFRAQMWIFGRREWLARSWALRSGWLFDVAGIGKLRASGAGREGGAPCNAA